LPAECGERAELRIAVRIGRFARSAVDGPVDETRRTARPTRSRSARAVPETDALEVPPRGADDVGRTHIEIVERRDCGAGCVERLRAPAVEVERDARVAEIDVDQIRSIRGAP
jgi:hypothetical protein